ncbi:hypothetical protein Pst134EB_012119 [Puccinia striiformis f. sp. tritici]|nr:hypothetical protein Pst134EB_012119 [Puccinia striiformis f. sp. tritici]
MNFPLSRQWMVDNEVNLDDENPKVKNGVTFSDGDGTVSVMSLKGRVLMIPVIIHEIEHRPASFDIRGGSTSADHIDILGSAELNENDREYRLR